MVTRLRAGNERPEPLIHLAVPLRELRKQDMMIDSLSRMRGSAELAVTGFESEDHAGAFKRQLKTTFHELEGEGLDFVVLKAAPGDIPSGVREDISKEFDFQCNAEDDAGHPHTTYYKVFDRLKYGNVLGFVAGIGAELAGNVMSTFKGNLYGLRSFLNAVPDPMMVLDTIEVGCDGDPFLVAERIHSQPGKRCICDDDERRRHRVALFAGYQLTKYRGSGLTHILARRRSVIRKFYGGAGVSDEDAADGFLNAMCGIVKSPQIILPSKNLLEYRGRLKVAGDENIFLNVVVKGVKRRHIVTAYVERGQEGLRRGLSKTVSEGVPPGERGRYLRYANAYLGKNGFEKLNPKDFSL